MGLPPNVNQLVTAIQGAPAAGAAAAPGPTTPGTAATSTSQLMTFTGYPGPPIGSPRPTIGSPGGQPWRLLYLDLRMECWLLIEESGIVDAQTVRDDEAPSG